jgi:hypothetical protein
MGMTPRLIGSVFCITRLAQFATSICNIHDFRFHQKGLQPFGCNPLLLVAERQGFLNAAWQSPPISNEPLISNHFKHLLYWAKFIKVQKNTVKVVGLVKVWWKVSVHMLSVKEPLSI